MPDKVGMVRRMPKKFTYIDLFCGCGGLAFGLEKSGFELVLGVEKSDMAAETFYHNFIRRIGSAGEWEDYCGLPLREQLEKKLVVSELNILLEDAPAIRRLRTYGVDLIAGGPPCQGFSMAGRRNPRDARNKLPWQFIELIELLSPKAVIIENVVGMRQFFAKHNRHAPFDDLRKQLEITGRGYAVQPVQVNAKNFGVPQHRPRLMLIGLRVDLASKLGVGTSSLWDSEHDVADFDWHEATLSPEASFHGPAVRTVQDALWDIDDAGYAFNENDPHYLHPAGTFARQMRSELPLVPSPTRGASGDNAHLSNQNLRHHSEPTTQRFRLYQYLQANCISTNILNIPKQKCSPLRVRQQIESLLRLADFPAIAPDRTVLASTADQLCQLVIELATKKHTQRPLQWHSPSPTVLSLPDDFVHPFRPRTMTVRELARLQSFPDSFEFRAKETTGSLRRRFEVPQYTQVGNAVPPLLAEAVGKLIASLLERVERRRPVRTDSIAEDSSGELVVD